MPLSPRQRELLQLVVASARGEAPAVRTSAQALRALVSELGCWPETVLDRWVEGVTVDWRSAGLDPVDTALCELALAVVEQPDAPPSPALLRQLARAGVDRATIDEAIAWVDRRDFSSPERHTP